MGKNNNKPNKAKVVPPAIEAKEKPVEPEVIGEGRKINVIDANGLMEAVQSGSNSTLSASDRIKLLSGLDCHFMQPDAAKKLHLTQESVDEMNAITAAGWVYTMAEELALGKSKFASHLRNAYLPVIMEVAAPMGITFDKKLLPAPSKDDNVEINSEAMKLSKETKAQVLKEVAAKPKALTVDPTKIKDDKELIEAIFSIMVDRTNAYAKLADSANFYRAYLDYKIEQTENIDKTAEHAKVKEKSNVDLLEEIRTIAKTAFSKDPDSAPKCPIVLNGIGRAIKTFTSANKSPIVAFCQFRNSTKSKTTGIPAISDREVADYVRFLMSWVVDIDKKSYEAKIAADQKNIKVLSKDKKANAAAIEKCEESIKKNKQNIEHLNETLEYVTTPGPETATHLLENFAAKDKSANAIFKAIVTSYYSDLDTSTVDASALKNNAVQYAGVITNLFRDPSTPLEEYSEANIVEIISEDENLGSVECDSSKKE